MITRLWSMLIFKTKYKSSSDENLMHMIQKNDRYAFNELYDRYAHKLLHYFFRMLGGDEQKAQDFLQEICLKILQKPTQFDSTAVVSTWIYTIAHNMCKNEYRRLNTKKEFLILGATQSPAIYSEDGLFLTESRIDLELITAAIWNEVDKLDHVRRSIFLLRFQAHLSIKDIATILNCTEGTVKSRLYYITKYLAHKLKKLNPNNIEVQINEQS